MDMTGEYRIPAPRGRVWEALNDPDVLKAAIPGCETLEKISDEELQARVRAKVGPVNATFFGKVTLSDLEPPASYRISGEGSGGVAGFAKGGAQVRLAEDGAEATVLSYAAKADVGGKLAQIGSRLVQGTAKKLADEFFGNFSRIVAEREGGDGLAAAGAAAGNGAAGPSRVPVGPAAGTAAALGTPPPTVAPPGVDAALPPAMNVEAAAGGVPPIVPPETAAYGESAPPEAVASRGASTASREASLAAHAAATDPRAVQPSLLRNPLVWAAVAVLVLALLFLLL